jgi:ligand-binding sensor domain-containing protein/DNA-binding CsgD family transcriptional regulator
MKHFLRVVFYFLIVLLPANTNAFTIKERGYSFVKNYHKENYNAATQSWDIDQDDRKIMYFANNDGLLVFDGSNWRLYSLPNNSIVRSVCIDNENKIWVGGFNQIGYFYPNKKGELEYHSMLKLLEPQYRDFGEIWEIYIDNNRIIFQTFTAILEYKDGLLRPLVWDKDIHYSFFISNQLYVDVNNIGLHKLEKSQLKLIPKGDIFIESVVVAILPVSTKESVIITATDGMYLLNEESISPLRTNADNFIKKYQVFDAIFYKNYYFIGTVQNGLLILDKNFNPVQHLNQKNGLQNNTILSLFVDFDENLWLGLDNGIDYVKTNSPLNYIVSKNQVGAGYQSILFKGKLFFGTNQGLFYTAHDETNILSPNAELKALEGLQGQVWLLEEYDNTLFCGHDRGTFIIRGKKAIQISDIGGGYNIFPIPGTEYLLQGTYSGLIIFEKNSVPGGPSYIYRNKVEKFTNSGKSLLLDKNNNIWVCHDYKGIYRLTLTPDYKQVHILKHYSKDQGLPETVGLKLLSFEDQMVVSSEKGFYYYNREKDFFFPFDELDRTFPSETVDKFIVDPNNKNTWFFTNKRMGILKPKFDGSYTIEHIPFIDLSEKFIASFESLYFLSPTSIIISSEDGFVHFNPLFRKNYNSPFEAFVREIYKGNDSLLFGGNLVGSKSYSKNITVEYSRNSVRFLYTSPYYDVNNTLQYSYILEGFDEKWSEWTMNTAKEYTNLPAGDYIFKVKAQNCYGFISKEDKVIITVLPPWYQSRTAYILYVLIGIITIAFITLLIVKRFEKEKRILQEKQKNELNIREKEFERETLKAEQEIIKLRNEKLVIENQKKQAEIENKTKELASIAMQITYKNELLSQIRQKLSKVSHKMIHQESKQKVDSLIKTLEKDIVRDDEWEKFELSFDQVHEDFLKKLRTRYTLLSPKDLRLCAYLRMNLSSKEIAPLLNISIRGVEISRYRLRRKLDLDRDTNLIEFMMNL